jgi:hypothetical protein
MNKILNINNNLFFCNDKSDKIDPFMKSAFYFEFNKKLNEHQMQMPIYKFKFIFLNNVLNSFMIKNSREEDILFYFYKIQKLYHALNKFAFLYKFKKAPLVVNTDMQLNEIKENDKNIMCIYQEKSKYLFKITDLLKIINMSLINSNNFFSEPLCIKNPYNNLPFNKSILYSIYYFIIEKTKLIFKKDVELFLKFYYCNFNLVNFFNNYEHILREHSIINYLKNSFSDTLYNEILNMVTEFNYNKIKQDKIFIDNKFSKNKLIKIFMPYLLLYLNSKYLLVPTIKYNNFIYLEDKLKKFQKFNTFFGRIKINNKIKFCKDGKMRRIQTLEENDKHIKFNDYNDTLFLKDHLKYMNHTNHIINHDIFFNYNGTNMNYDTTDDNSETEYNEEVNTQNNGDTEYNEEFDTDDEDDMDIDSIS